jgi:hypothetical protein
MAGRSLNVSKILPAVVLSALVAAGGCGGSDRADRPASRELPRVLAKEWASQASAVADAAASGDNCRASQLAVALRTNIIDKESEVPARLQPALLGGVNALADRIVCRPPPQTVPRQPKRHEPPKHDHHDHHKHGDGQGNEG